MANPAASIAAETFSKAKKKLVQINAASVKGEPGTGLEDDKKGEFTCRNCEYFRPGENSCGQKDMLKRSKKPRTESGRVQVGPLWCCEYVDRTGKYRIEES